MHGNTVRGVESIHINIRSLFNKINEVKNIIKQEKPHVLGISEAELIKSYHQKESLKIPGYDILLPKSWEDRGKARVVVYVKRGVHYEQIYDLEDIEVQSIWLKAGFKNCKAAYYCHMHREHTNTVGSSLAAQRNILDKMYQAVVNPPEILWL